MFYQAIINDETEKFIGFITGITMRDCEEEVNYFLKDNKGYSSYGVMFKSFNYGIDGEW